MEQFLLVNQDLASGRLHQPVTPNKRLERTRHERASWLSCVGEPLKRSVRCFVNRSCGKF